MTKSGSNKFEFEFNATADSNRLRFFRDERDTPAPTYFYVINPMISGPIIKDKLWFLFNTESHIIQNGREPDVEGLFPDPETYRKFIQKGTLKLTWQVTAPQQAAQPDQLRLRPTSGTMRDGLGIDPEAQQNRHGQPLHAGADLGVAADATSLVFRSQVGFIIDPAAHLPPRCARPSPPTATTSRRRSSSFPRAPGRAATTTTTTSATTLYSLQFQNRLEWFLDERALGEHALQLKDNFYTEQDIRRYLAARRHARPSTTATMPDAAHRPTTPTIRGSRTPRFGWFIATSTASPPHRHPERRLAAHPLPDHHPGAVARLGHAARNSARRRR